MNSLFNSSRSEVVEYNQIPVTDIIFTNILNSNFISLLQIISNELLRLCSFAMDHSLTKAASRRLSFVFGAAHLKQQTLHGLVSENHHLSINRLKLGFLNYINSV